jgi:MoaA/NifB/PqqE/SkfB family radical SAM enzyme
VSRNGHFITEENCAKIVSSGLKKLIISADGITQESYEKYRVEGNLEKVKEGILNLALAKKNAKSQYPKIVFQFIIFKHNEQDVNEVKTWAKKLDVNKVKLKTAQAYNPETGSELLPENPKKTAGTKKLMTSMLSTIS